MCKVSYHSGIDEVVSAKSPVNAVSSAMLCFTKFNFRKAKLRKTTHPIIQDISAVDTIVA